jgi:hypothetical protein
MQKINVIDQLPDQKLFVSTMGQYNNLSSPSPSPSPTHITTDGQSVCLSWCRAPSGAHDQILVTVWQFLSCLGEGALSDERVGLSFVKSPSEVGQLSICTSIYILHVLLDSYAIYTRPLSVQAQYSRLCPISSRICYCGGLDTWTVVCLTAHALKCNVLAIVRFKKKIGLHENT